MGFISDRSFQLAPASVRDHRELARKKLPRALFDYIDGGAYEEKTMAANERDLGAIQLRQRVLRDVSSPNLQTSIFGTTWRIPVALAPIGLGGMFAQRAEVQAARAAEQFGVPFCESTVSICSIEEVAEAISEPFWYQLYVMRDRDYAAGLMARAQLAGCDTLVLTVDLPVVGERYHDTRNGLVGKHGIKAKITQALDFAVHPGWVRDVALGGKPLTFGNLSDAVPDANTPDDFREWVDAQFDPSVSWDDLAWVRENWPGNIVLKGILDAEDARAAREAGVEGIVVSNHGGRQLDDTPSTAKALGDVVSAVGDDLCVLVDGGVRSGLDVVKLLALGAQATLIGRPWAYAVAGGGQAGVTAVFETIEREMRVAMGLVGATSVDELDRSVLVGGASDL